MGWLLEAFWELSTDRPITMGGAGPIPRSAMTEYIVTEGVGDARAFRQIMRSLDNHYLQAVREKHDDGGS